MTRPVGRPSHERTDEKAAQVEALVSFGVTIPEICTFIGVSEETLRKYYKREIETAKVRRNAKVASFLFHSASGDAIADGASYSDCLRASMFWLKTQAGFKERHEIDHTSTDGSMSPRAESDAVLAALKAKHNVTA